jgi:diguanylate cyclase (GGDEF)-like protein
VTLEGQRKELIDEAFWLSHMRVGFGVFVGEALAILVYLHASPEGPHRVALRAIAVLSVCVGALSFFGLRTIAGRPWRANFSLGWSLFAGWALAYCAHLDGGIDSPLLYLILFPVIYAALAYRPAAVVACGISALAQVAVLGATDSHIMLSGGSLLMIAAVVGGMSVLAVAASVYRTRLQANEALLVRELAELADTDGLTGCLNHRAFHRHLALEIDRAIRHETPLSLVVVDVDDFKLINDTYGHPSGDDALVAVADALRTEIRRSDVVGRVGGDEFAIVLAGTSLDGAATHARRISRMLARQCDPTVALSIGIARLDPVKPSASQLLRDADRALYHVKGTGRDGIAATSPTGTPVRLAS